MYCLQDPVTERWILVRENEVRPAPEDFSVSPLYITLEWSPDDRVWRPVQVEPFVIPILILLAPCLVGRTREDGPGNGRREVVFEVQPHLIQRVSRALDWTFSRVWFTDQPDREWLVPTQPREAAVVHCPMRRDMPRTRLTHLLQLLTLLEGMKARETLVFSQRFCSFMLHPDEIECLRRLLRGEGVPLNEHFKFDAGFGSITMSYIMAAVSYLPWTLDPHSAMPYVFFRVSEGKVYLGTLLTV